MNKLTWVPVSLFLVFAGAAEAGPGVAIRWNACLGDGGVANRNFACNTNSGSSVATCSFVLPAAAAGFSAVVSTIDVITAGATLPVWWEVLPTPAGLCRTGALTGNAVNSVTAVVCQDWGAGGASGIAGPYVVGGNGPSSFNFDLPNFGPTLSPPLAAGTEYFQANLRLTHVKSTGLGACAGCATPACIAIRRMHFYDPANGSVPILILTAPMNGIDSNYITWQGGAGAGPLPGGACAQAVRVRNSTWGDVKALYR